MEQLSACQKWLYKPGKQIQWCWNLLKTHLEILDFKSEKVFFLPVWKVTQHQAKFNLGFLNEFVENHQIISKLQSLNDMQVL